MKTHNFYQKEEKELISINITPLIDIVFLLLVFFMLATSFIQKSTIEVNLSSGETLQTEKQKNDVILTLNKTGQIYLNNKLIKKRQNIYFFPNYVQKYDIDELQFL